MHTHENVCIHRSAYHHQAFTTITVCNVKFVIFLKIEFQVRHAAVDVRYARRGDRGPWRITPSRHSTEGADRISESTLHSFFIVTSFVNVRSYCKLILLVKQNI